MNYLETFENIKKALIASVKTHATARFQSNLGFDGWDATPIQDEYVVKFQEAYAPYFHEDTIIKIREAAGGIVHTIKIYVRFHKFGSLKPLLAFVVEAISVQLRDFKEWCEIIHMTSPAQEPPSS